MNFKLDCTKFQDGSSLRQHLEAVEARTGKRPHELDECGIPRETFHIWEWFWELNPKFRKKFNL
ncbi:MAG: hypothetical protein FWG02_11425 [Holophagaceae bacterium]|nr:hypothetical protein [Holophagaceae bacterium]